MIYRRAECSVWQSDPASGIGSRSLRYLKTEILGIGLLRFVASLHFYFDPGIAEVSVVETGCGGWVLVDGTLGVLGIFEGHKCE